MGPVVVPVVGTVVGPVVVPVVGLVGLVVGPSVAGVGGEIIQHQFTIFDLRVYIEG